MTIFRKPRSRAERSAAKPGMERRGFPAPGVSGGHVARSAEAA